LDVEKQKSKSNHRDGLADVRRLMYRVKHAQGVDITRIFCGLNEVRNIIPSIKYAKEAGMIPQATLCITYSPVHTVDYYSYIADQLIEAGAPEICLKDMAGIGRPEMLGQLVRNIKDKHPEVIVQYHGHSVLGYLWHLFWKFVRMVRISLMSLWSRCHGEKCILT
jgi:pyruvate/oxaloacetate carboxyltransferase